MPSARPSAKSTSNAASARMNVLGIASASASATGRCSPKDSPMSPRARATRYFPYWTGRGSSQPNRRHSCRQTSGGGGLAAPRGGRHGLVHQPVDLRVVVTAVVGTPEPGRGPGLGKARRGRRVGVPRVEDGIEPAGAGPLVEQAEVDLVELDVHAG